MFDKMANVNIRRLAGWALSLTVFVAGSALAAEEVAYQRQVTFVRGTASQPALMLFRMTPQLLTDRLLLVAPGETRIVSTVEFSARQSESRMRLTEDETGAWVEVERQLGMSASGIDELLDVAMDTYSRNPDLTLSVVVRTSGGVEETCRVVAEERTGEAELIRCLLASGASGRILDAFSPRMIDALPFLSSALVGPWGATHSHSSTPRILLALAEQEQALSPESRADSGGWAQHVGEPVKGLVVEDGPWKERLRTFRHVLGAVSGAAPLSDTPRRSGRPPGD